MKNLKLLALAFVIGSMSMFATTKTTEDIPVKQIRSEIRELLKTPDFYIDEDISIDILFTFDSQGKIFIVDTGTKNRNLTKYIMKCLDGKKIATPGEKNKVFTLPLKIKKW